MSATSSTECIDARGQRRSMRIDADKLECSCANDADSAYSGQDIDSFSRHAICVSSCEVITGPSRAFPTECGDAVHYLASPEVRYYDAAIDEVRPEYSEGSYGDGVASANAPEGTHRVPDNDWMFTSPRARSEWVGKGPVRNFDLDAFDGDIFGELLPDHLRVDAVTSSSSALAGMLSYFLHRVVDATAEVKYILGAR